MKARVGFLRFPGYRPQASYLWEMDPTPPYSAGLRTDSRDNKLVVTSDHL